MERTSVFDRLGNRPFSMNKYEKDDDEDDSRNVKTDEVELRIKRFKSDLVPFSTSPIADSLPSPRTPPSLDSKRSFKSTVSTKNDNKIKSTVGLVSTQSLKKSPFSSPSSLKSDAFNQKRTKREDDDDDEEEILERKRQILQKELELEIEREKREQEKGRSSIKGHGSTGTYSTSGSHSRCSSPVSSASGTCSSTDASGSKSGAGTSQSGGSKTNRRRRSRSYSSFASPSPPPSRSHRNSPQPSSSILSRSNNRIKSKSPILTRSPRSPLSLSSFHQRSRNSTPPHLRAGKGEVKLDRHGNVRISLREKEKQRNLEKERARREREKDRLRLLEREKERLRKMERERERRRHEKDELIKSRSQIKSPTRNQTSRVLPRSSLRSPLKSLLRSPPKDSFFSSVKDSTKPPRSVYDRSDLYEKEYFDHRLDTNASEENETKDANDKNLTTLLPREDMSPISNNSSLGDSGDSQFSFQERQQKSEEKEIIKDSKNEDIVSEENFSDWSEGEDDILLNSDNKEDLEDSFTAAVVQTLTEQSKLIETKDSENVTKLSEVTSNNELQDGCSSNQDDALEAISDDEFDAMICEKQQIDSCNESQHSIAGQMMIDALEIDWASLISQPRPKQSFVAGSAIKRFNPANVLSQIGISQELAGPKITQKIIEFCKNGQKDNYKPFHHTVAALHCLINDRIYERSNVFQNKLLLPNGLNARKDLQIRKILAKSLLDCSHFYSKDTVNSNTAFTQQPGLD